MDTVGTTRKAELPDPVELGRAYEECQSITKASSTNFYYAFLTLPPEKRRSIYAAYAFCRLCDDIVDDPDRGDSAAVRLLEVRERLAGVYEGRAEGAIWIALRHSQQRYGIPMSWFVDVIDGCEMDLTTSIYDTFEEVSHYCRRVASAVGLICIEICGYEDKRAVEYAIDLGMAMQLTNILRDLGEDARAGRVYLPREELDRFGYSKEDLMAGVINEPFRDLMRFQVDRARRYFESGSRLFPLLDRRSRACPRTIASVYRGLLERMESADYDVFSRRVSLGTSSKVALAARLWLQSRIPVLS